MHTHDVPFARVDSTTNPQAFVQYLDIVSADAQMQIVKKQSYMMLALTSGQMILDVGSGTGGDVRSMAEIMGKTGKVIGVDNSETMIATARERSFGFPYPVDFHQADIMQLPFADATFDGVRSERVFQHLKDRQTALTEMMRVTKPGGRIVITDADLGMTAITGTDRFLTRRVIDFQNDDTLNGWSGRELPGLFHQVGLTNIEIVPFVLQMDNFRVFDAIMNMSKDLKYAQSQGILTAEDISTWIDDIVALNDRQEFFAAVVVFSVKGQRPKVG